MFKTRYAIPGTAPATLATLTAPAEAKKPVIRLIDYDPADYSEKELAGASELPSVSDGTRMLWLDIDGLGDAALFKALGEKYGLHPLALEDVLRTGQRPKLEPYEHHLFIVAQMVYNDAQRRMCGEQVSIFLCKNMLITIQEEATTDVFEPVRERLRAGRGYIRKLGPDYLAYALLDSIVDHCFPILEEIGDVLEQIEEDVLARPTNSCVQRLHAHKRTLMQLRRFVWPERDVCNALLHDESGLVSAQTKIFLRDCYDHTVQIMDLIESYRDVVSGLTEMYLSAIGIRTNEIMRVLTVISAIFIPLTFIAGVYGMNFDYADGQMPLNLPELHHPHGYIICMAVMALIATAQLIFFKRKNWL